LAGRKRNHFSRPAGTWFHEEVGNSAESLQVPWLRRLSPVTEKPAGTLPGSKASALSRRGMKGPLLRNLAMDIRQQKSREGIYRNLFPDL